MQLPSKAMGQESADGFELVTAFLFVQPEHVTEVLRFGVPV
jgi:hypothetical protein